MTVKNITKYHELDNEELNKLGTRELVNALESARKTIICSCGSGHHCGDEVLDKEDQDWNKEQNSLHARLKDVLKDREDVSTKEVPRKVEKKKMKY